MNFHRILLLLGIFFTFFSLTFGQTKTKIILDTDTGNEVDDPYAIVRVLLEPSWEVTAINATHWQTSHWAEENTMENSSPN